MRCRLFWTDTGPGLERKESEKQKGRALRDSADKALEAEESRGPDP